jgi:hypothetical protein
MSRPESLSEALGAHVRDKEPAASRSSGNATLLQDNPVDEVSKLKRQSGEDLLIYGEFALRFVVSRSPPWR